MSEAPFALSKLSPPIRMALGVTGAALLAGVAFLVFGILPARQRIKALTAEIAQLGDTHATMKADIAGTRKQQAATEAAEAALARATDAVARIDKALTDPKIFTENPAKAAELGRQRETAQAALEAAELEWLDANEAYEALKADG